MLHLYPPSEWSETGWYTVFTFVCLCVCLWALSPIGLNGWNDVLFTEKCIRLVCEKLTLFPYGQDIVGNVVLLAFWSYGQIQDRSGGFGEMYKNVAVIAHKMDAHLPSIRLLCTALQRDHSLVDTHQTVHLLSSEACIRQCSLTHFCRFTRTYITREART